MQEIFVVTYDTDYEGSEVAGAFSTHERAEDFLRGKGFILNFKGEWGINKEINFPKIGSNHYLYCDGASIIPVKLDNP